LKKKYAGVFFWGVFVLNAWEKKNFLGGGVPTSKADKKGGVLNTKRRNEPKNVTPPPVGGEKKPNGGGGKRAQ